MTAEQKIAQGRLTLLQLAENLKNVSEACRRRGITRSRFYEYKRAFQEFGFEGLIDSLPIRKTFPNATPQEIRDRVKVFSLEHPALGKEGIADRLKFEGIALHATTIRKILLNENLETKYKRLLYLEEARWGSGIELTEEQIRLIEKMNPCFKERKVESPYPGYLLCQDTFEVGHLKGIGRVYLQAVIDTYGSHAFGKLYTSRKAPTAADILYDRVFPFYERHGITIEHILTDNGSEYCGTYMRHPYEILLELYDIKTEEHGWPHRGRTGSSRGSTGRSSTSTSGRSSGRSSSHPSKSYKRTLISGSIITITNVPTGDIGTWGEGR
jgi:hypothetical protein